MATALGHPCMKVAWGKCYYIGVDVFRIETGVNFWPLVDLFKADREKKIDSVGFAVKTCHSSLLI